MKYRTQPPWDFLLTASRNSLQSYELSRLAHCANLRKEISQLLDNWIEENASAMFARWILEQRERAAEDQKASANSDAAANTGHSASDNFLADYSTPSPVNRERC